MLPAANRYTTNYDLSTNVATLKIDNAQMNDLGSYLAFAENIAGKDQTNCSLFVKEIPNIDQTPMVNPDAFRYLEGPKTTNRPIETDDDNENLQPPKVIVPLQDLELNEGEAVILMCKIIGKPKPKVINLIIIKKSIHLISNINFKISNNSFFYNQNYIQSFIFISSIFK